MKRTRGVYRLLVPGILSDHRSIPSWGERCRSAEYYSDDVLHLSCMLRRDLSCWLDPPAANALGCRVIAAILIRRRGAGKMRHEDLDLRCRNAQRRRHVLLFKEGLSRPRVRSQPRACLGVQCQVRERTPEWQAIDCRGSHRASRLSRRQRHLLYK